MTRAALTGFQHPVFWMLRLAELLSQQKIPSQLNYRSPEIQELSSQAQAFFSKIAKCHSFYPEGINKTL